MRSTLALVALLLLSAREPGPPRYRDYVPGPGFREEMEVGIARPHPSEITAGIWVELHAERRAGPWQLADSTTEDPACRRVSPIAEEFEVASKVQWEIRPSEGVTFNVPGPPDYERE